MRFWWERFFSLLCARYICDVYIARWNKCCVHSSIPKTGNCSNSYKTFSGIILSFAETQKIRSWIELRIGKYFCAYAYAVRELIRFNRCEKGWSFFYLIFFSIFSFEINPFRLKNITALLSAAKSVFITTSSISSTTNLTMWKIRFNLLSLEWKYFIVFE